ncbi:MAG: hypothetical protein ISS56_06155 [Anaerolineae bacterium]|nr:hypothetical protein [Anaerolineae bacterium]
MPTVIVHVMNEDPFVAEIEKLPEPADQCITFTNPRRRDNKPLHFVTNEAISVIYPWHRLSFLEVMPGEESQGEVELFFRP